MFNAISSKNKRNDDAIMRTLSSCVSLRMIETIDKRRFLV